MEISMPRFTCRGQTSQSFPPLGAFPGRLALVAGKLHDVRLGFGVLLGRFPFCVSVVGSHLVRPRDQGQARMSSRSPLGPKDGPGPAERRPNPPRFRPQRPVHVRNGLGPVEDIIPPPYLDKMTKATGPFGYRPLSGPHFHNLCPGAQFHPHPPDLPRYSPEMESNTVSVHYSHRRYRKVELACGSDRLFPRPSTVWAVAPDGVRTMKRLVVSSGSMRMRGVSTQPTRTFTTPATANHANGLVVHRWPGESGDPALPNGDPEEM
eukprot:s44_g48.t1